MSKPFHNLGEFINELKKRNDLITIDTEVSANLEIAEIHRRVIDSQGKALLFTKVQGCNFPVATNLFGTLSRVNLAFGTDAPKAIERLVQLAQNDLPPSLNTLWKNRDVISRCVNIGTKNASAPVTECTYAPTPEHGLTHLPALKQWPLDGGNFITLPLVYSEDPDTHVPNIGMYRMQIFSHNQTGMHWQIQRGGGFHFYKAEAKNQNLPVSLFLGGPPALTLAAIAPLPENIPETLFCSFLLGQKIPITKHKKSVVNHPIFAEAEFAIQGFVSPHIRKPEGPFGDHFGNYSLQHPYPVFTAQQIFHRKNAIFPATIVGKPRQEDFYIGAYLQNLFLPLLKLVMPGLVNLNVFGDSGFHAIAAAQVKNRYWQEAMVHAFRLLGEGQLSLQKYLLVTDNNVPLDNFADLLQHFLARTNWNSDLFVFSNVSQDTLDYTGPKYNQGSKAIWIALGEPRYNLCRTMPNSLPNVVSNARIFVPGCLVIEVPPFTSFTNLTNEFLQHLAFSEFRMVVMVDSLNDIFATPWAFTWILGTRTEPASCISSHNITLNRFHTCLAAPVFFDARIKPGYPTTVEACPIMEKQVSNNWSTYFSSANK